MEKISILFKIPSRKCQKLFTFIEEGNWKLFIILIKSSLLKQFFSFSIVHLTAFFNFFIHFLIFVESLSVSKLIEFFIFSLLFFIFNVATMDSKSGAKEEERKLILQDEKVRLNFEHWMKRRKRKIFNGIAQTASSV